MNILFIVGFSFPLGEASSIRALNLVRLFNLCKYRVHVISDYNGIKCDNVPCTYEAIEDKKNSFINMTGIANKSIKRVKHYCLNNKIDLIIMNAKSDRVSEIIKFAKKNSIKVIVENCEWYNFSNYKLKLFDYRFWKNQKMMYLDLKKANGFISISRYLHNRNIKFAPSTRIPTILDVTNISYRLKRNHNYPIVISYTGNPGVSKELLSPIIDILLNNRDLRDKIVLNIYGVNKRQLLKNHGVTLKKLVGVGNNVNVCGRVSQDLISKVLYDSDYLIFIRPIRKSSNAGFPTKLGESMSAGTPVITNITGDIDLYVTNGENGFLFNANDYNELEKILYRVVEMSNKEHEKMRILARKTAETHFDYRKYENSIKELIEKMW